MIYSLSKENFAKLSEFIYRKSGLYLEEKEYDRVALFVEKHFHDDEIESFESYFFTLRFEDSDGLIFQKLVNAVTINDTYFYREKEHFKLLVDTILPELHTKISTKRALRILSAPCATGEEAYSILLHLLEESDILTKRDVEIVGIDINSRVIEQAKDATYTARSVEGIPADILEHWFTKKASRYKLSHEFDKYVDFQVANIYDKNQMSQLGKFDVIFSRNMLIYFNEASRKEVAMIFYEMLNPEGYIFLGHAEHMKRIVSIFKTKKIENSIVYQK